MKYGTGFPLIALNDAAAVRDFAQTYDGAGLDYVTAAGHLLSTPAERYEGRPQATYAGPFLDPFVLFSYLAGQTSRLHFVTSILILPLYEDGDCRQAVGGAGLRQRRPLRAGRRHQLARAGVQGRGPGRAPPRRAPRRAGGGAEAVRSKPFFSFKGKFHDIDNMGLNRLPAKPIPLWFGSTLEEKPMRRAARFADGWMPMADPTEPLPRFKQYMTEAGRNASALQLMSRVTAGDGGPDAWIAEGKRLQALGATHITIGTPPDVTGAAASQRIIEAKNALAAALG